MPGTNYRIFASVTPGLEPLLQRELEGLGLQGRSRLLRGGVECSGDQHVLWLLALHSRLSESLRVRLGKPFVATTFAELQQQLVRLPWAAYLRRAGPLPRVHVTSHRSRLYHSGAIEQRVREALVERMALTPDERAQDERAPDERAPDERARVPGVFVRVARDRVQVSIDASGELLHRRGYRTHVSEAPLRETLAAACLLAAGYAGEVPCWDPFCGGGTVVLEALAVAAHIAPGARRSFVFEQWPSHDAEAFAAFRAAQPRPIVPPVEVFGSDVDPHALTAAAANAERLGPHAHAHWLLDDFARAAQAVPREALIITNPPYGHRLGRDAELRALFRRFGELLRERGVLRRAFVLAGHPAFAQASGLGWSTVATFTNRGLPVQLLRLEEGA